MHYAHMDEHQGIPERLTAIRERAGLTVRDVASRTETWSFWIARS